MDRKLLNYLPPVLREVSDFQAINKANEPEIAAAWDALTLVLVNQFLETADSQGVAVWEKELGIFPRDTDSLELRKVRVKSRWNRELPYTLPWLKRWLDGLYGPERHKESLGDYTLRLQLDCTDLPNAGGLLEETAGMLEEIRPCGLLPVLNAVLRLQGRLRLGGTLGAAVRFPVPEVEDSLDFRGEVRLGGGAGAVAVLPVPEQPDRPDFRSELRAGGKYSVISTAAATKYEEE